MIIQILNGWFQSSFRFIIDRWQGRFPFLVRISIQRTLNDRTHVFYVEIINRTKNRPLYVHGVRVHYGNRYYNHSFVLLPKTTADIKPGASHEFHLSYKNSETEIKQVRRTKDPKIANAPPPLRLTFDNNGALFKAIANGDRRDSWIEIDFNEFKDRQFCRGQIKRAFLAIIQGLCRSCRMPTFLRHRCPCP